MQRIMHAHSQELANSFRQTCFTRRANAFEQACKHVPGMAFVHVNTFAKAFAFACERVCLCVQTHLAWRANAFEMRVRYTLHLAVL